MGKTNPPRPEDAFTGVTPGWQSGVGASDPIPEKDKVRIRQTAESSTRQRSETVSPERDRARSRTRGRRLGRR
jgi:hypothetical protein